MHGADRRRPHRSGGAGHRRDESTRRRRRSVPRGVPDQHGGDRSLRRARYLQPFECPGRLRQRTNLTDDQMRAAAARGGVIGVNAFPAFVARHQAPTVEHLLDHIEYMVRVVGDDHVGLGFDFSRETEEDYKYFKYKEDVYPKPPWVYPAGID